jgi:hypothetical protein
VRSEIFTPSFITRLSAKQKEGSAIQRMSNEEARKVETPGASLSHGFTPPTPRSLLFQHFHAFRLFYLNAICSRSKTKSSPDILLPRLLDGRITRGTLNSQRSIFADALSFPRRINGNPRRRRITPENQPIRQITRRTIQPLAFLINLAANIARRRRPRGLQQRDLPNAAPSRTWLLARVPERQGWHQHRLRLIPRATFHRARRAGARGRQATRHIRRHGKRRPRGHAEFIGRIANEAKGARGILPTADKQQQAKGGQ